ncbi:uncharacterized protein Tco025E_05837 [Trypanosoma conorhini]|uniref:Uncharacterized protein n=1 Tax=Trypanosoma conorhini TaxID=83891 RepID=A0A422P9S4_9TRYP|nr:uncharacterized protein Tco025E_05837 [Trypanosoma conorhini]RNF14467.1 hypothetical protein Tco025E_05837 [Trypanosoma conorhini]
MLSVRAVPRQRALCLRGAGLHVCFCSAHLETLPNACSNVRSIALLPLSLARVVAVRSSAKKPKFKVGDAHQLLTEAAHGKDKRRRAEHVTLRKATGEMNRCGGRILYTGPLAVQL